MVNNKLQIALNDNNFVNFINILNFSEGQSLSNLNIKETGDHYIYKGAKTVTRYFLLSKTRIEIKRWIYFLCFGNMVDSGKILISNCGIKNCVHPYHLKITSMSYIKNISKSMGSKLPQSKLTEVIVMRIKKEIASGQRTLVDLADEYKISYNTIKGIKSGRVWKHVII